MRQSFQWFLQNKVNDQEIQKNILNITKHHESANLNYKEIKLIISVRLIFIRVKR